MTWTQIAAQGGSRADVTGAVVFGTEIHCVFAGDSSLQKPDGAGGWTQVAAAAVTQTYRGDSPIVYSGSLYAILKAPTAGLTSGGKLHQLVSGAWSTTNTPSGTTNVLAVTNGARAFTITTTGSLFEYVGVVSMTQRSASTAGVPPQAVIGFGTNIWAGFTDSTLRYVGLNGSSGTAWTTAATLSGESVTALGDHGGELYVGTNIGKLYKWNGASLDLQLTLTSGKPITSILSFNSKVYCGISAT